jgi:SNF2 family DNA or RNA helicase
MKTKGMSQQTQALRESAGKRNYAFLMEQGTGKTWTTLADAERCFIEDKIEAVLVIAPKGVHSNWVRREIPKHMSAECITFAWRGTPTTKRDKSAYEALYAKSFQRPTLRVFAINIDAINTESGYDAAENFISCFRTMAVIDESTRIKNPGSKRTKACIKLGRPATCRRILTGAPLTKGPPDLFSQFEFLKPGLLGTTSYRAFVAEFAVLLQPGDPKYIAIMRKTAGRGNPQIVATDEDGNKVWKNLDKLRALIQPHSFRVRKDECLDLPPKIYQTVNFALEPAQRKIYDRLKEDYNYITHDMEDRSFEGIAARTKLKQVTSGFIFIDGVATLLESNQASHPRMSLFKDQLQDIEGPFIVWAMFEEEINQIMAALKAEGIEAVSYYGKTKSDAREAAIDDFQARKVRAFVGHAAAAGIGLTLNVAETVIYYSCSEDNDLRLQSEDRAHRIGTVKPVVYIDLVAEDTIDEDMVQNRAAKTATADYVIDGR